MLQELRHVRVDSKDRMAEEGVDILFEDLAVLGKVISAHAPGCRAQLPHRFGLGALGVDGGLGGHRRHDQAGNIIL